MLTPVPYLSTVTRDSLEIKRQQTCNSKTANWIKHGVRSSSSGTTFSLPLSWLCFSQSAGVHPMAWCGALLIFSLMSASAAFLQEQKPPAVSFPNGAPTNRPVHSFSATAFAAHPPAVLRPSSETAIPTRCFRNSVDLEFKGPNMGPQYVPKLRSRSLDLDPALQYTGHVSSLCSLGPALGDINHNCYSYH